MKFRKWPFISSASSYHAQRWAVASGGPVVPHLKSVPVVPHLKYESLISCLAPWLLHTSNRVFLKCGPPSGFWPLHLVFGPPAAIS